MRKIAAEVVTRVAGKKFGSSRTKEYESGREDRIQSLQNETKQNQRLQCAKGSKWT